MNLLAADQPPPFWIILLFFAVIAATLGSIVWRCIAFAVRPSVFPRVGRGDILFRERFASGGRLDGPWFRRAAFRNCLKITLTRSELWIHSVFPFRIFDRELGMEHRIPLTRIVEVAAVDSTPGNIRIEFVDASGEPQRLGLLLRNAGTFLEAIESVISHEGEHCVQG